MTAATTLSTPAAGRNCWDPRTWNTTPATKATATPAGHNCWDPRTWTDGFDAKAVPAANTGLTNLSNPLVQNLVKQNVENFFKGVAKAVPTSAPMNPERFQNFDATPKFLMGAKYQAYNINGELMVKVSSVTRNPGSATWYDLGKVPAADVVSPSMPSHNCWDPQTWGK